MDHIIDTYCIETAMGRLSHPHALPFLNPAQVKEFNAIGYTGKNSSGVRTTQVAFLNSLGLGDFKIIVTKPDMGDFSATLMIIRVTPRLPLLPKHLTPKTLFPQPGIYRIHWKSGSSSLAAVGQEVGGDLWMAPINWLGPVFEDKIWDKLDDIQSVELLNLEEK